VTTVPWKEGRCLVWDFTRSDSGLKSLQ
jgi:hypothetical protein